MNLSQRWQPGQLIGERYRIESYLAEGGAGEVYSAQNVWTSRLVAVKRLLPDLQSEATLVGAFSVGGQNRRQDRASEHRPGARHGQGRERRVVVHRAGAASRRPASSASGPSAPAVGGRGDGHDDSHHRGAGRGPSAGASCIGTSSPENIFVLEAPFGQRIPKLLDFGIAKVHEEHTLTRAGERDGDSGLHASGAVGRGEGGRSARGCLVDRDRALRVAGRGASVSTPTTMRGRCSRS